MDISKLINNYSFYEGYEEDRKVELFLLESPEFHIHIWEGFFEDILADPPLSGDTPKSATISFALFLNLLRKRIKL